MIDNKCEAYLIQEYGEFNYKSRLRDFTNEEVRKALLSNTIADRWGLFRILSETVTDPEAKAHVLDFESAKERTELIAEIKAKQAKLKD